MTRTKPVQRKAKPKASEINKILAVFALANLICLIGASAIILLVAFYAQQKNTVIVFVVCFVLHKLFDAYFKSIKKPSES